VTFILTSELLLFFIIECTTTIITRNTKNHPDKNQVQSTICKALANNYRASHPPQNKKRNTTSLVDITKEKKMVHMQKFHNTEIYNLSSQRILH